MFRIQAGSPAVVPVPDGGRGLSLSDAMYVAFPPEADHCLLIWNHIFIPVSYRYDLSLMIDDCLDLTAALSAPGPVHFDVDWPSNTFAAHWDVEAFDDTVRIESSWETVLGSLAPLLNERSSLGTGRTEFLSEWRRLYAVLDERLHAAGCRSDLVTGMERLR